jgi:periplasmic divalent cation tolerance protein
MLFIYMTCATADEARAISTALLDQKLVACANIMSPHTALYRWEGKVQEGTEVAVILKTRTELFDQVKTRIVELHSYDCPCIVALPIEKGHEPFLQWIGTETEVL